MANIDFNDLANRIPLKIEKNDFRNFSIKSAKGRDKKI